MIQVSFYAHHRKCQTYNRSTKSKMHNLCIVRNKNYVKSCIEYMMRYDPLMVLQWKGHFSSFCLQIRFISFRPTYTCCYIRIAECKMILFYLLLNDGLLYFHFEIKYFFLLLTSTMPSFEASQVSKTRSIVRFNLIDSKIKEKWRPSKSLNEICVHLSSLSFVLIKENLKRETTFSSTIINEYVRLKFLAFLNNFQYV